MATVYQVIREGKLWRVPRAGICRRALAYPDQYAEGSPMGCADILAQAC